MLVDTRNFQGRAPDYFRPFDAFIRTTVAHNEPLGYQLPRLVNEAQVFHEGTIYLLDLKKLPPARAAAAR